MVNFEIVNKGNRDLQSFKFGLSYPNKDLVLHCDGQTADRHHIARVLTELGPGLPTTEVDFELAPFNRKDSYTLTLFVVAKGGQEVPGEFRISSSEPVVFRKAQETAETVSTLLRAMLVRIARHYLG